VKAFYSDTFVLPLPDGHRFPMEKYSRLRHELVARHILHESDLAVPEPASWSDLRLVHTDTYVQAVATGTLPADAQRRIGFPWSPQMVERSRR
jgi:acetoin utilization deacetylase AcuC-like enzyme